MRPRDIPGYWSAQIAGRGNVYNHDKLEAMDDLAFQLWAGDSWASVLDLRPLWYRSDAKVNPCQDVVHFCMPGPFRSVASWLMAHINTTIPV